ncbi:hypothetical protein BS50DRAFT_641111 [Corynespora cassiicola Philippines]|uniref:Uncharacterized protein n=1 Tax=Corynespora cassiicola Philippines TaxID=1448308 RepID=A0A2T2N1J3_CORCC|nr:hypothetical protein BS50DRAFT_641111 [Corynespora cassiicola Philippines]
MANIVRSLHVALNESQDVDSSGTVSSISAATISAIVTSTLPSSFFTSSSSSGPTPTTGSTPALTSDSGIKKGEVAGIAIGCLIAGAIVAAFACILFFRRQNEKRRYAYSTSPKNHLKSAIDGHGRKKEAVVPATNTLGIEQSLIDELPQPVEDKAIIDDVSRICDGISNHIRVFYDFRLIQSIIIDQERFRQLAACTGIDSSDFYGLLEKQETWEDSMRLLVAWIILRKCDGGNRHESLLPGNLGLVKIDEPLSFSKWKVLTATLLKNNQNLQSPGESKLFKELNAVLAPFVQGSSEEDQRRDNLNLIIRRAAALALLLFSQPGSFRFDFSNQTKGIVVFPALVQIVGDQAQKLSPPRLLLEKEMLH